MNKRKQPRATTACAVARNRFEDSRSRWLVYRNALQRKGEASKAGNAHAQYRASGSRRVRVNSSTLVGHEAR